MHKNTAYIDHIETLSVLCKNNFGVSFVIRLSDKIWWMYIENTYLSLPVSKVARHVIWLL